jgi:hypothetical protein
MNVHLGYALDYPVFDPDRQIESGHFWAAGRISIGLTCNIGME